jgi:hypothetical protein
VLELWKISSSMALTIGENAFCLGRNQCKDGDTLNAIVTAVVPEFHESRSKVVQWANV